MREKLRIQVLERLILCKTLHQVVNKESQALLQILQESNNSSKRGVQNVNQRLRTL
jgi:hypothetical protein